jgi:Flp pilus assembly protein TadD
LAAQEKNDMTAAIRAYELAIRHGDSTGVAANNLAWILAERGEELDRALHLARTATQLDPANPAMFDTLGYIHLARREYSEAVVILQKAHSMTSNKAAKPASPETAAAVREHLAEAYLHVGETLAAQALRQ